MTIGDHIAAAERLLEPRHPAYGADPEKTANATAALAHAAIALTGQFAVISADLACIRQALLDRR